MHTGRRAEELAEALRARAFTIGSDVVFGRGEYAPWSAAGRRLLAHELAHVVQAADGTPNGSSGVAERSSLPSPLAVSRPSDVAERQAERVADRLSRGDASLVHLDPIPPGVLHRAEPDVGPSAPPVELPSVDVASPESLALAERTAEEINATVARDWEEVRTGTELDALLLANQVENILRDTFEMGHGAGEQLGEADAPVLQYFVAQYPDLRPRLAVLRDRAGIPNTLRIEKYLGITTAETRRFSYEIHMIQFGAGRWGIEIAEATVRIRYVEEGKPVWTASYEFVGIGAGVGLAPGGQGEDIGWNTFYTAEYWAPGDFPGWMDLAGAGAAGGGGWESEAATFYGNGTRVPIVVDVGGQIAGTPEIGVSVVKGRLMLVSAPRNAPAPPAPPGLAQPIPVHDELVVEFATNRAEVDNRNLRLLADFVARNSELFAGGDYELQLIGNTSRAGNAEDNLGLSERRRQAVRAEIEALLRFRELPPLGERVAGEALGEQQAVADGKPPTDDSAEYRTVEIALNGTVHREIPPP